MDLNKRLATTQWLMKSKYLSVVQTLLTLRQNSDLYYTFC